MTEITRYVPGIRYLPGSIVAEDLQRRFERQQAGYYLTTTGANSVREIVKLRLRNSNSYNRVNSFGLAAMELSLAAHSLEIFAQKPRKAGLVLDADVNMFPPLNEAVKYRFRAIRLFRQNALEAGLRINRERFALELSYLSKTLGFLAFRAPKFSSPKIREQMIALRNEAAGIFAELNSHENALFEYGYLADLQADKAIRDGDLGPATRSARQALHHAVNCERGRSGGFVPIFRLAIEVAELVPSKT